MVGLYVVIGDAYHFGRRTYTLDLRKVQVRSPGEEEEEEVVVRGSEVRRKKP